ncbi:hypothetical protein R1flu_021286 [Riccia fluitans]|uniref:Uncharacterized protein n=1 Tax=Riccia fluitans TaxID=41844 RepID=A0ABD1ZNZ0_9MARC
MHMGMQKLEQSPSWRWSCLETARKGWTQPMSFWHKLYETEENADNLAAKWLEGQYALTWEERWRLLWKKGGLPRVKLWTWKLLRRAFFTRERAATMQVT